MVKFKSCINTKLPYAIVRLLTVMWALPLLPFVGVPVMSLSPTAKSFFGYSAQNNPQLLVALL
jgi:hypothetical protein